jgi:hypothetical protein
MRPRLLALLALPVSLIGCGYSPERFASKVSFEWCDWRHACGEIDAGQAEICWETEEATWLGHLASDECDYAKDRSKRLYRMYVADLQATDCSLSEAYTIASELAEDICGQPHSSWDTQEEPEDTGDSGA